ncbi:Hpt domain-containing protein [Nitratifractor sp.]|uniref:Hpt domain-containing protein n=1 Tax=Nitratifractor sp. TaxID=2268144 RepID=UPI0025F3CA24|nr:Hpt domain-containing protein [Nitratifractor sp.]
MYLIINEDHRIIAATPDMLKELNVGSVYEALQRQEEGTIEIDPSRGILIESTKNLHRECTFETLPSLLGQLRIATPAENTELLETTKKNTQPIEEREETLDIFLEEESLEHPTEKPALSPEETNEAPVVENLSLKEENLELLETPEEIEIKEMLPQEQESAIARTGTKLPLPSSEKESERNDEETSDEDLEALLSIGEETENPEEELLLPEEAEKEMEPEEVTSETSDEDLEALLSIGEEMENQEEEPLTLKEETPQSTEKEKPNDKNEENFEELLTLEEEPLPPIEEKNEATIELKEEKASDKEKTETIQWRNLLEEFHLDIETNAGQLELSPAEYSDLIREFITDSLELRDALLSDDSAIRTEAIASLRDAATLLQLEALSKVISSLRKAPEEERSSMIEALYERIDLLAEKLPHEKKSEHQEVEKVEVPEGIVTTEETAPSEKEISPAEEAVVEEETPPSPTTETSIQEEKALTTPPEKAAGENLLEGVTAVPIDFSLKIAAEELNLPEDLVLEFINDFAAQGHEYLPTLIQAYESGDLDKLQKTAHMLKGAASNLRIEPMVENLYELQFDNDISRAPKRIRLFLAQLMSLDKYLKQMNGK